MSKIKIYGWDNNPGDHDWHVGYCPVHGCYYEMCGFITEPPKPIPTRFCRKCGNPGAYVRTRYFEDSSSDVWECQTIGCENHNLIWHTDTPRGERSPVVDIVLDEG